MRLVRYEHDGAIRAGILDGERVRDAGPSILTLEPGDRTLPLDAVRLRAPVDAPEKVVCLALNYRDHAAETGAPLPEHPMLFSKWANTVIGPGEPIRIPRDTTQVDYEAELGVVIGREARDVTPGEALSHVLGYTCVNDVSARAFQFTDGQWVRGKSLDTFCPTGPWIVTTDEIPDPQTLGIRLILNGAVMQDSSTKEMLFGVAELVSFISRWVTLRPGDLIATGTPAGVGFVRNPQVFLTPGDTVRVEIHGIGALENPVAAWE